MSIRLATLCKFGQFYISTPDICRHVVCCRAPIISFLSTMDDSRSESSSSDCARLCNQEWKLQLLHFSLAHKAPLAHSEHHPPSALGGFLFDHEHQCCTQNGFENLGLQATIETQYSIVSKYGAKSLCNTNGGRLWLCTLPGSVLRAVLTISFRLSSLNNCL
jgi:hypothetical protein